MLCNTVDLRCSKLSIVKGLMLDFPASIVLGASC